MFWAADLDYTVGWLAVVIDLGKVEQAVFSLLQAVKAQFSLAAIQKFIINESFYRRKTTVEVDRTDYRFKGVGDNCFPSPPQVRKTLLRIDKIIFELEPCGFFGQSGPGDDRRLAPGQISLAGGAKPCVKILGNNQVENCVSEKFLSLVTVVVTKSVLVYIRQMRKSRLEQFYILKIIPNSLLKTA